MRVLAFVSDLMFRSRIDGGARPAGAVVVYAKAADVETAVGDAKADLVLVDMSLAGVDVPALIAAVRAQTDARIVAFGSHVNASVLAAALAAGADKALPRSTFVTRIAEILSGDDGGGDDRT